MTKEEKRQNLAKVAYSMLIKQGVDKFSLNTLLQEVGMSKGVFYHYFKDKNDLFYEVIVEQYGLLTQEYFSTKETLSAVEDKIINFFATYLDESEATQAFLKIMHDMYFLYSDKRHKNFNLLMQEMYQESFEELGSIIQEGIDTKVFKAEAIESVKSMVATADGMFMYSFLLHDFNLKEELERYLNRTIHTLRL